MFSTLGRCKLPPLSYIRSPSTNKQMFARSTELVNQERLYKKGSHLYFKTSQLKMLARLCSQITIMQCFRRQHFNPSNILLLREHSIAMLVLVLVIGSKGNVMSSPSLMVMEWTRTDR